MKKPRLRFLGRVYGLRVYLVSGEYVRTHLDIDFTQGGNEAVYPTYNPAGEIWIDDATHVADRMATTFHEIVERDMMLHHGMDYDHAHDVACKHELPFRRELERRRPTSFDARRIEKAVQEFMRNKPRTARQLDREIDSALWKPSKLRRAT